MSARNAAQRGIMDLGSIIVWIAGDIRVKRKKIDLIDWPFCYRGAVFY